MTIRRVDIKKKLHNFSEPIVTKEGITMREWISLARLSTNKKEDKELINLIEEICIKSNLLEEKLFEFNKIRLQRIISNIRMVRNIR